MSRATSTFHPRAPCPGSREAGTEREMFWCMFSHSSLSPRRSSGRRLSLLCTLIVALSVELWGARPASAETAEPDLSLYRLHPAIDTGLVLSGVALWTGAFAIVSSQTPNRLCNPCDPSELNPIDRPFIQFHEQTWRRVGDSMYGLPFLMFLVLDARDVGFRKWRIWLTDFMIIMEGLVLQGAVTEIWRRSIQRPRPFLYVDGIYPDERASAEATFSFYSGHVSAVFELMTGIAYTWTLRHPHSRWKPLVWTGLMLAAALSPIARVGSGDHFPTDVLVGAVVGTGFGLAWPALRHYVYEHGKVLQHQISLSTWTPSGGMGLSLAMDIY